MARHGASGEPAEDGTVDNWLRGMNELFKTFGRVPEVVDPKRYYLGSRYVAAKV